MALRAVVEHPKFAAFKKRLDLPKGAALGWLETVWHFAGRFTPHGDIGKYSDSQIESWAEWDGQPGALVAALVAEKWLDISQEHRLVVHDWEHHADKATKAAVKRSGRGFIVSTSGPHAELCGHAETDSSAPWVLPGAGAGAGPGAGPERMDPEMLAKQVQVEARISDWESLPAITDQCRFAQDEGQADEAIVERMVASWRELGEANAARKLEHRWGAKKFFGEGHWRDPRGWPWKQGSAPAPIAKPRTVNLDEINAA